VAIFRYHTNAKLCICIAALQLAATLFSYSTDGASVNVVYL